MSKTALLYSPEGGNVNRVTIKLGEFIGNDKVELIPVKKVTKKTLDKYEQIIFLGSTVGADHWSNKHIEDEWGAFFLRVGDVSLEHKKLAIVGLGNSVLYPEHFADGMALLHKEITKRKGKIVGFVNAEDYTFTDSAALDEDGFFCGLAIDEDNEDDLTPERLEKWIFRLKLDFEF